MYMIHTERVEKWRTSLNVWYGQPAYNDTSRLNGQKIDLRFCKYEECRMIKGSTGLKQQGENWYKIFQNCQMTVIGDTLEHL